MSDVKLRIDQGQGILEVEGNEEFVREILQKYAINTVQKEIKGKSARGNTSKKNETKPKLRKKRTTKKSYKPISNLEIADLKTFCNEKKPSNNFEHNLAFIYFLEKKKNVKNISEDHIFTCYRLMNKPVPGNLYQSLIDTRRRKMWIETDDTNDLNVTTIGENYVLHEMGQV